MLGMRPYTLYTAIASTVMAEIRPPDIDIGLLFNLVVALPGGTTPYLATWLQGRRREKLFPVYVCT